MAFQISDFTSALTGDGARPNLFQVVMTIPGNGISASAISFMVKAAQLPGSTIGTVPMYYFGREMKFAGNRTFADWTVTVVNDESFAIRNAIESWMNNINSNVSNLRLNNAQTLAGAGGTTSYTTNAQVNQYGKTGLTGTGGIIKSYNFIGMFPVDIAPIDLDWGTNDTIEEFSVTFAYQYWTTGVNGAQNGITS